MNNKGKYYILMADIIDSSHMDSKSIMNSFKNIVNRINRHYRKSIISPMTITLGDEFQCIVKSLADGINIIIRIEELNIELKSGFKLRYVLNYGDIDTNINNKIAYEMLGPGLKETRQLLNNMKKMDDRLFINSTIKNSNALNKLLYLLLSTIDNWKIKDYDIIHGVLNKYQYYEIAKLVNRDPSTISKKIRHTIRIRNYLEIKTLINRELNND